MMSGSRFDWRPRRVIRRPRSCVCRWRLNKANLSLWLCSNTTRRIIHVSWHQQWALLSRGVTDCLRCLRFSFCSLASYGDIRSRVQSRLTIWNSVAQWCNRFYLGGWCVTVSGLASWCGGCVWCSESWVGTIVVVIVISVVAATIVLLEFSCCMNHKPLQFVYENNDKNVPLPYSGAPLGKHSLHFKNHLLWYWCVLYLDWNLLTLWVYATYLLLLPWSFLQPRFLNC